MSLHVSPSTSCNLGCTYCYEEPDRSVRGEDGKIVVPDYDMDAIFDRLEAWKQKYPHETPGLHGGEPLLMATDDVEAIFKWVHENYEGNGGHIQTNATLITDRHLELFQKYNVHVGISCDGPPELNVERQAREGDEDVTDRMSVKTGRAITRCREAGVDVGLIVVAHKLNCGTDEKLEKLLSWIDNLNRMGVTGHFNPAIPYEDIQTDISLSGQRLAEVYVRTWEWMQAPGQDHRWWNPMRQYQDNLLGLSLGNCVNQRCDVFNAGAAKIIKGNGESTGCGKTWDTVGDGVAFLQGDSSNNEYNDTETRYEMLKRTPGAYTEGEPDMGGCKGCKYWNVCQGGCPSAGLNDDYRNRTVWCEAKYALYERIEQDMRHLLPNIRLITDYEWNDDLHALAETSQLDISPFGKMDPAAHQGKQSWASTFKQTPHPLGTPESLVPEEYLTTDSLDRKVAQYEAEHGSDIVTVDEETGEIHADSDIRNSPGTDDDEAASAGWEPADD